MKRPFIYYIIYGLCCLVLALATHTSGLFRPATCDYSVRLRVARDWHQGKNLYNETYENTQPTYFMFLLLCDSSWPAFSVYLADSVLAAVSAVTLRAALSAGRPLFASLCPLMFVCLSGTIGTYYGGYAIEDIALYFDLIGVSSLVVGLSKRSLVAAFASGGCYFIVSSLRIPYSINIALYLGICFLLGSDGERAYVSRIVFTFAAGFLFALSLFFLHAIHYNYLRGFVHMIYNNMTYASLSRVSWSQSLKSCMGALGISVLGKNSFWVTLIGFTVSSSLGFWTYLSRFEKFWLKVCPLWMILAVISALPGGRHYGHYYHFLCTPLAILSTLWVYRLEELERHLGLPRLLGVSVLVSTAVMAISLSLIQAILVVNKSPFSEIVMHEERIRDAVRLISELSDDKAVVPMCLWSDWSELYWRSPRPSVSPCTSPFCFDEVQPRMFDDWAQAMLKNCPQLIITDAVWREKNWSRAVNGGPCHGSHKAVFEMIKTQYEIIKYSSDLVFYARRGGTALNLLQ